MAIVVEHVQADGTRVRTRRPLQPLDPDRRVLAANAVKLAYHRAHEAREKTKLPLPDLAAVALKAVTEAAARYDPSRGVPFGPYAGLVIRTQLTEFTKKEWAHQERTEPMADAAQVADRRQDSKFTPAEAKELVARVRRRLKDRDWDILWRHFAEGMPLAQLARELNVSKNRVSQLAHRALATARKLLKVDD